MRAIARRWGWRWGLRLGLALALLGLGTAPVRAAELPRLDDTQLQQRLADPISRDGAPMVDLTQFEIDLRPANQEFANRFYDRLKRKLVESDRPLGLDLSGSIVRGTFDIERLSASVPLYSRNLSPLLSDREQQQLERDRRRISQLRQLSRTLLSELETPNTSTLQVTVFRGKLRLVKTRFADTVNWTNTFFLDGVEAVGAAFGGDLNSAEARFSKPFRLTSGQIGGTARFRSSIFFESATFDRVQFGDRSQFNSVSFESAANFRQAQFDGRAEFESSKFVGAADFAQTDWGDRANFSRAKFVSALYLNSALFAETLNFREAQFAQPVNLRGASLMGLADFSDAQFNLDAYLNVSNLTFDSDRVQLVGNPGQIGNVISIPTLQGNENLLRNLVRNFRDLEQIEDANQVNYQRILLVQQDLLRRLRGTNVNIASAERLQQVGFSQEQAAEILDRRQDQPFTSLSELLDLESISLSTYVDVSDRPIASPPISRRQRLQLLLQLSWVSLLLVLSRYGTNFSLVFGVGAVEIAYFSLIFWWVDRFRRRVPQPIVPTREETAYTIVSGVATTLYGFTSIFQNSPQPWLTLVCMALASFPIPFAILWRIYRQGRYHDLMDVSYFVEDGGFRELRLTISRLPVIPRFPFFRDRFEPILWDRRWNWLNYYDFSLNNLLKFGFNDIRLRDRHMPGLITALAWYQWGLGLLYVSLLLWTLSRTIPGLNLFLYLK